MVHCAGTVEGCGDCPGLVDSDPLEGVGNACGGVPTFGLDDGTFDGVEVVVPGGGTILDGSCDGRGVCDGGILGGVAVKVVAPSGNNTTFGSCDCDGGANAISFGEDDGVCGEVTPEVGVVGGALGGVPVRDAGVIFNGACSDAELAEVGMFEAVGFVCADIARFVVDGG